MATVGYIPMLWNRHLWRLGQSLLCAGCDSPCFLKINFYKSSFNEFLYGIQVPSLNYVHLHHGTYRMNSVTQNFNTI